MNAVKLYVSTARLVLENDQYDFSLCKLINSSFANLEFSLTCTVCRSLLKEPYSPNELACQHHVCKNCMGGHKKLKPSCSWCKDFDKYHLNTQLQCLLGCYKGLCQYIKCTALPSKVSGLNSFIDREKRFLNIINRGAQLSSCSTSKETKVKMDLYSSFAASKLDGNQNHRYRRVKENSREIRNNSSEDESCIMDISKVKVEEKRPSEFSSACPEKLPRIDPNKTETHTLRLRRVIGPTAEDSATSDIDSQPLYSVAFASTRSKLILKRRNIPRQRETQHSNEDSSQLPKVSYSLRTSDYVQNHRTSNDLLDRTRFKKSKHKSSHSSRPACRCGTATNQPGKLTCCGQRCACYMQKRACSSCRCRGCRNPHLIDGVKILGKFLKCNDHSETRMNTNNSYSYSNSGSKSINQVVPSLSTESVMDLS